MLMTRTPRDYSLTLNFPNVSTKLVVTQKDKEVPLATVVMFNTESLEWVCPPWLGMDYDFRIRGIDDQMFSRIVSWLYNGMKEEPNDAGYCNKRTRTGRHN